MNVLGVGRIAFVDKQGFSQVLIADDKEGVTMLGVKLLHLLPAAVQDMGAIKATTLIAKGHFFAVAYQWGVVEMDLDTYEVLVLKYLERDRTACVLTLCDNGDLLIKTEDVESSDGSGPES